MMTIKHIELSGTEQVHECTHVWFNPEHVERAEQELHAVASPTPTPAPRDTLYAASPSQEHPLAFSSGTLFVMNEHGKTVSRYDLGASMVSHGDDARTTHQAQRERTRQVVRDQHTRQATSVRGDH